MSARHFLAGFAKSVLVHRHAFISSRGRTLATGLTAELPASFEEAFGSPPPAPVDAAIAAGSWPAALRALDAWAKREPRLPEPRIIAGVLRLWPRPGRDVRGGVLERLVGRYASAQGLRALTDAVRDFPLSVPARVWLALAQLRHVDLPEARRQLDQLVRLKPDWSWPYLLRSELGRVDITYDAALADLDRAERLEPAGAWVQAFRGRVLFAMGRRERGLAAMDRAVAAAPRAGWIRAWRADSRRQLGDLAGAAQDLRLAARLEPAYDRTYLWLGKVLLARGEARAAERALTRGLALCPHFEKAFAERARARLALGRVDAALGDLDCAVRINHRHNSLRNWTAELEPVSAEKARVLGLLAKHADRRPRSARVWGWLGEALVQAGEMRAGLAALDRAFALNPGRPWLRSWRGEGLLRLGRLPEAERELDEAVRADPADGRARAFRGRVRFLRGKAAGAVADLEKAASDSMIEYSWIYHWRAEAKAAAGDRDGARADSAAAVALEPGRSEFRRLYGQLEPRGARRPAETAEAAP